MTTVSKPKRNPARAEVSDQKKTRAFIEGWSQGAHLKINASSALRKCDDARVMGYLEYNFIKIHRTLRMSPAMAAGGTDRLWSVEDLVAFWEAYEQRRAEREA